MDVNRIVRMLTNMFLRKAMNRGVKTAIDLAGRKRTPPEGTAPEGTRPEDREQAARGRDLARRAQKAARITRRLGR
ncbi:hypothetical protein [Pseudogemmobacter sonorensis]|uniref:hypothetical protein n=1 Tax=Pseudogemmobacter sonorensis TaxID=2989681 RepID=UPI0036C646D7